MVDVERLRRVDGGGRDGFLHRAVRERHVVLHTILHGHNGTSEGFFVVLHDGFPTLHHTQRRYLFATTTFCLPSV